MVSDSKSVELIFLGILRDLTYRYKMGSKQITSTLCGSRNKKYLIIAEKT
jgi:hypothetical protein